MTKIFNVAVIIPVYQGESFLAKTLQSVACQTILPRELIVIDDGSTDATGDIVESFIKAHTELSVLFLRNPHQGPGAARNAGIMAADSDWIAFLDSDDHWFPDKLKKMYAATKANPECNFFCHNEAIKHLDNSEAVVNYGYGFSYDKPLGKQLYLKNFFSTSAVVCRRELLLKFGGFDQKLKSAQDYELWLRMSPDISPVFVPDVLGVYVLRNGNITTSNYWKRLSNLLRVKHKHRRKGGLILYVYTLINTIFFHIISIAPSNLKKIVKRFIKST